jgi:DNA-binding transcriptional ArsR family regulator
MTEVHLTTTEALRAMAHPLRIGILGSLRIDGPATSAMLARRLGTDSGQTSHHLRMLARHGFVVDAPELGKGLRGRERWWRAGHESTTWSDDMADLGPAATEALRTLGVAARQVRGQISAEYEAQALRREWSPEWRETSGTADAVLHTDAAGLAALRADINRLIEQYDQPTADGAETVIVFLDAFPRKAAE